MASGLIFATTVLTLATTGTAGGRKARLGGFEATLFRTGTNDGNGALRLILSIRNGGRALVDGTRGRVEVVLGLAP